MVPFRACIVVVGLLRGVGHRAHLASVHPRSRSSSPRSNVLITVALDKRVKVWDIRFERCMQTLCDPLPHQPENSFTSALWDARHSVLYTAGHFVRRWPMVRVQRESPKKGQGGQETEEGWKGCG